MTWLMKAIIGLFGHLDYIFSFPMKVEIRILSFIQYGYIFFDFEKKLAKPIEKGTF